MPQGKRSIQSYLIDKPIARQSILRVSNFFALLPPPEIPPGPDFGEWEFRTDESVIGECMMECARGRV